MTKARHWLAGLALLVTACGKESPPSPPPPSLDVGAAPSAPTVAHDAGDPRQGSLLVLTLRERAAGCHLEADASGPLGACPARAHLQRLLLAGEGPGLGLVLELLRDERPVVRYIAAVVAGDECIPRDAWGDPKHFQAIRAIAEAEKHNFVAVQLGNLLACFRGEATDMQQPLISALRGMTNVDARAGLLNGVLSRSARAPSGPGPYYQVTREIARSEGEPAIVRAGALYALGLFAGNEAAKPRRGELLTVIGEALASPTPHVAEAALRVTLLTEEWLRNELMAPALAAITRLGSEGVLHADVMDGVEALLLDPALPRPQVLEALAAVARAPDSQRPGLGSPSLVALRLLRRAGYAQWRSLCEERTKSADPDAVRAAKRLLAAGEPSPLERLEPPPPEPPPERGGKRKQRR